MADKLGVFWLGGSITEELYTERGWITLHGLESVEKMYKEYHNLGGNGTITKLVEDVRKLEVKDD